MRVTRLLLQRFGQTMPPGADDLLIDVATTASTPASTPASTLLPLRCR